MRTLAIRGAPAIGVAGAMGVAAAARRGEDVDEAAHRLATARPTAVNLAWAVAHVRAAGDEPGRLAARARALHEAEVERCRSMSRHALPLFPAGSRPLTHCNTGALATGGHGTALGAIVTAFEAGRIEHVYVDETRPLLQGARLTAWELARAGIPFSVIVEGAAASALASGRATHVVTGADRIAANGDTANKVGTYGLAVLARHHGVPMLVVAPTSTVDLATPDGAGIVVEERDPAEVTAGWPAWNPAFDVTPAALVDAIVTEAGVHRPPLAPGLAAAVAAAA
ncbi:MAG: S-methyl-5-thioribose-1-phosphate isomerase [Thermoleophilia bacterium]